MNNNKNTFIGHMVDKTIKIVNYIFIKLFSIFPLNKCCIVLNSKPDFSDNAWSFYDYLIRHNKNKKYRIIWLVENPKKYKSAFNVVFIRNIPKLLCLRRDYYLATAKFVIFTHSSPIRFWRKEQVFISTTHSASQLKSITGFREKNKRIVIPNYILRCGNDGLKKMMDGKKIERKKFLVIGMPRLDLLFRHKDCLSVLFPRKSSCKFVLILETFKQSKDWSVSSNTISYGMNILNSLYELSQFNEFLKENDIVLIIKPHPLQDVSFINIKNFENFIFITDDMLFLSGIQLYELIENCDALLTDYSSVFYDYLLLNRPIGFMVGDIKKYSRGFISNNPENEMPGKIIPDLLTLKNFILDVKFGRDEYKQKRESLINDVFKYKDNNNSFRLFSFIESFL